MTPRRTPSRSIRGTILALLSVAVTASLTLTSAAIAQAAEPVDIGPDESQTQLTQNARLADVAAVTEPGTFASLEPARILDTRVGSGAPQAKVAPSGTVGLQVTGRGGVPASDVAAVVVNVTVTEPSTGGFITVYPFGTSQPTASNLNFTAGQNIPNLVTVKVGTDGKINLKNNSAGSVHLIADVAGYYVAGTPTVPGAFVSLDPARVLDTRVGNGAPNAAVAAQSTVDLQITGRGGVPADGVAAVVVNVTVTGPATGGFITVYPSGSSQPTASNLNFSAGQTIPNLVTVKLGTGGKIKLTNNSAGTVQLIADVAGYYLAGTPTVPGAFVSVDPSRVLDTRVGNGTGQAPVPGTSWMSVQVTARGGVPAVDVAAVVMNVTVTEPITGGFITVYPNGTTEPTASNLNFSAGQNIPNLAAVKVGGNGRIALANNSAGTVHLIADIAGYFLGSPENLDEVWPSGWIFDDCGTDWDELLLVASPGIAYSPQPPTIFWEGETYYDLLPGTAGEVVVTVSAEPGYVVAISSDATDWVANGDGSYTGTILFDVGSC